MAQKHTVQLIDDLTNEPIEDGAGESVHFSLDGVGDTIDLSTENAEVFRRSLAQYVSAAGKAGVATLAKPRAIRSSTCAPKTDLKDVRDWAS